MKKKYMLFVLFLFICTSIFIVLKNISPTQNSNTDKNIIDSKSTIHKEDPSIALLDSMTLDEKIGQLFIFGYTEKEPSEEIKAFIQKYKIGGIIFFKRNYQSVDDLINTTNQLNSWNAKNPLPLFLSIDEEGGSVSRIPAGCTKFPHAKLLGQINQPTLTYNMGRVMGKELSSLGINLDYAPVLDIVFSKRNKLLFNRSFSNSPEIVSNHSEMIFKGLQDEGIISVAKHFPGHGDTIIDSHGNLPHIMIDKNTLMNRELVPFKNIIDQGIEAIMIGHLSLPKIDNSKVPATRSKILVKDILRNELGFNKLIITDDLDMKAYTKNSNSFKESILQSIHAGIDIFLICHTRELQLEALSIIKNGVQTGEISEDEINASVLRIIKIKNKYKLAKRFPIDVEKAKSNIGTLAHKKVLHDILMMR
ncbi:beta-N-acetylhexosaminidase [Lutibacter sp. B2]|nr:beta-N-acetylhexosaminidase [Lutibacter sp. B2]